MSHIPHISGERLESVLCALDSGVAGAVERLGLSPALERNLRPIAHIYASRPERLITDVLTLILVSRTCERALLRFGRYMESAGEAAPPAGYSPVFPRILANIFIFSSALSQRIAGSPVLAESLARIEAPFLPHTDRDWYWERYRELVEDETSDSGKVRAVHRMQTVQLMRICARSTESDADIASIGAELSALAESVIEICLDLAAAALESRSGIPRNAHSLIVLGLGKLGGSELNVSSDIDLIFLYTDRDGGFAEDPVVYHTQLAERLTRLLTEPTELGALYRVDTRLRADGASGPLVRSTPDYFRYLEMRGEAWERQMLLKARPVAGDREAAEAFLGSLERFIFPATITRSPHREVVAIKNQIEARLITEGSKKTHLKLMPGGIRDIEFIAQCLQLLMGGIHPEVRATGTITALEQLRNSGALNEREHRALSSAYILYRRMENALQWRELLPAFNLPENEEELDEAAVYLGYDSSAPHPGALLRDDLDRMRTEVRTIFLEVFSPGGSDGSFDENAVQAALGAGDERTRRFLESLGFPEPEASARRFARLVFGEGPVSETLPHPSVERFAPLLLKRLSGLPDPDGALERLASIIEAYRARHTLFDILSGNPKLLELLLSIAHDSVFLADILVRDPSLLDWLVEVGEINQPPGAGEILRELRRIDRETDRNEEFTRSCLTVKNREKLRVGARAVTGLADTMTSFTELTTIAECVVRAAYERAVSRTGGAIRGAKTPETFSVIAAGRFGAEMMDFGSDLDLIFVYRGSDDSASGARATERSVRLAQTVLALLTGGGGVHKAYEVDARLRPEGGSSLLAVSLEEYRRYLETRAAEWERLAMTRARPVAGNEALGEAVASVLREFAYGREFTWEEIDRIIAIRERMVEQSRKRHPGKINVKSGAGGLADLDFIAQAYSAHYGVSRPGLRLRRTDAVFAELGKERLIERTEAADLVEAYRFLCGTERALRIGSGRSVNTLPESGIELARAARLLGFGNIRKFRRRLEDVLTLSRERYERLMKSLRERTGDGSA